MAERQRMKCPKCGGEMNHHADKLVAPIDDAGVREADPIFGGLIEETHACPACANVEFRRSTREA